MKKSLLLILALPLLLSSCEFSPAQDGENTETNEHGYIGENEENQQENLIFH